MTYYKGNRLYNVKKLKFSFIGKDIQANWRDSSEGGKEKLGHFRFADPDVTEKP